MYSGDKAVFRLLCNLHTEGHVIDSIRSQTHTRISISDPQPIPNSQERVSVISIFGDTRITEEVVVTKKPKKNGTHKSQNEEEVEIMRISNAQKALLMVFERVIEGVDEVEFCRLLVPEGEMRHVVGKRGWVVKCIQNQYRVSIWSSKEFLPACALPGDELIQITGNGFDLKKAMLVVSHRLQPYPARPNENPRLLANYNQRAPLSCGVASVDDTNDLPMRLDRDLNLNGKSIERLVLFRLLCPYDTASGIIGRNAGVVKAMESKTGASIRFSAQLDTSRERVATIVAFEKPDHVCSPAQAAVLHVFTRCLEVKGMDKSSVEARVLVRPEEINCLVDDSGRISADIILASGVEIQLLGAPFAPSCAKDDDIVVQLTGKFAHVKETLYQITGRLRKRLFAVKVPNAEECWHDPHSSSTSNNSSGRGTTTSSVLAELPITSSSGAHDTRGGLNQKFATHFPMLPHEMFKTGNNNAKVEKEREHITSEVTQRNISMDTEAIESVTVEIAVPEQAFGNVYGENGNNLARLKQISGAAVRVQDPLPGENNGKVIISGTLERVQVAQSLLYAFICLL